MMHRTHNKYWLFFLSTLLIPFCSQSKSIDSLLNSWNSPKNHDTIRLESLSQIIIHYAGRNIDSASFFLDKQISYAANKKVLKYEAAAYNTYGSIHTKLGNHPQAVKYYLKAIDIYKKTDNLFGIASIYNNLGSVYEKNGDYDLSLKYYNKSFKIINSLNREKALAVLLNNIGYIYHHKMDYKKAIEYFQKSYFLHNKFENQAGMARAIHCIGTSYLMQGEYVTAEKYLSESLEIRKKIGQEEPIIETLYELSKLFFKIKKYNQAKKHAEHVYKIAHKLGLKLRTSLALHLLYEISKETKDYKNSTYFLELYHQVKDSILNEKNQREILSAEFEYAYKNKAITDSLTLEKEKQKSAYFAKISSYKVAQAKKENRLILIGLVLLSFFLIAVIALLIRGKKLEKELSISISDLQNNVKQKEVLLKEVHHRVKNNLAIVGSMLEIESDRTKNIELKKILLDSVKRIGSMSIAHRLMYQNDNFETIEIEDLVKNIILFFVECNDEKKERIITYECDNIKFLFDKAIPIGIILNELITNSIKHYNNETKELIIEINFTQLDDRICFTYKDNGNGFKISNSSTNGMGLFLINSMEKQLNASVSCITDGKYIYSSNFAV